ncbi:MAG: hypothetical protein QOG66_2370 [Methylobacteriaceae bacterium]|jgi:hypothetical protein|nr:hypothetical protein [Methylobacteriaceae bacterium]
MQKFFFHVVSDGLRHEDEHGTELASLHDAYLHAQTAAKWLLRGIGLKNGFKVAPSAYIEIESECGQVLMLLTIAHLLAARAAQPAVSVYSRQDQRELIGFAGDKRMRRRASGPSAPIFSRQTIVRQLTEAERARKTGTAT